MKHRVHVRADPAYRGLRSGLSRAAWATFSRAAAPPGEASIVLTDDQRLRELHRTFLGEDKVTDVLSFPDGKVDPETGTAYFGDLVIAVPQAARQAAAAGHALEAELILLTVHGALHLLGYDHDAPRSRERMWSLQGEILRALGAPRVDA